MPLDDSRVAAHQFSALVRLGRLAIALESGSKPSSQYTSAVSRMSLCLMIRCATGIGTLDTASIVVFGNAHGTSTRSIARVALVHDYRLGLLVVDAERWKNASVASICSVQIPRGT